MRPTTRLSDDADVIRARLRALLDEARRPGGWLPDALSDDEEDLLEALPDQDSGPTVPVREADPEQEAGLPAGLGRHRAPDRTVRWDPGRRGGRSLWIAGLVAALLLAGWTWLDRPRVEPAPARPADTTVATPAPATTTVGEVAETSATVVVSVVGLVARPGLVTLPTGARVAAAIEAAGGLRPEADPASVNLAAVVTDGEQIAVGVPGTAGAVADGEVSGATGGGGRSVDLNAAGAAELDALPGIGPVLAQRIVDYRTQNGPFTRVDQLDDVPGIGPAIFAELRPLVTV